MGRYLACFKAYDIRGKVPGELNPEVARAVGRAFVLETGSKTVCVGHDIRLSGPELCEAFISGLNEEGCDAVHLGMVGTEMVYFATAHYGYDGGVMVTASHNPPEYNGMKMVRSESRPISGDSGLGDIEATAARVLEGSVPAGPGGGGRSELDCYSDFVDHLLRVVPVGGIKRMRVLASPGNGAAGVAMDALIPHLPVDVVKMQWEPDGSFPNGVPNPILEESRAPMEAEMAGGGYDLGVAWDGDYDRCFFFDESGTFIEGYYIVGLLARAILAGNPGGTVIYDPRLTWNTLEIVAEAGGRAVMCKSGHAFIKERMRAENAVYGGEMSAHHYFRDHWYCDSGMIPVLLVLKLVSETGKSLGELVGSMMSRFPCSGEVNSTVVDVAGTLARIEAEYGDGEVERTDGLSVDFGDWRFNLRGSNTEPVIRLNVESRGDVGLMREKTESILGLVRSG